MDVSSHATGTYNHMAVNHSDMLGNDMKNLGLKSNQVSVDDILHYSSPVEHSSLVCEVANQKPSMLRWKWQFGGIYGYTRSEWDTPMCVNRRHDTDVEVGKTPAEKGWTWNNSYAINPDVYTVSDPNP